MTAKKEKEYFIILTQEEKEFVEETLSDINPKDLIPDYDPPLLDSGEEEWWLALCKKFENAQELNSAKLTSIYGHPQVVIEHPEDQIRTSGYIAPVDPLTAPTEPAMTFITPTKKKWFEMKSGRLINIENIETLRPTKDRVMAVCFKYNHVLWLSREDSEALVKFIKENE